MRAVDDDAGTFGELEFSLGEDDRHKPFVITTLPGGFAEIFTTKPLDFEQAQCHTLNVIVEDLAETESNRRLVPYFATSPLTLWF